MEEVLQDVVGAGDVGTLAEQPRRDSARYRASEQSGTIGGVDYRLLVLYSDHLDARKRGTLPKALERLRKAVAKELSALAKRRFCCEADAEAARSAFAVRHSHGLLGLALMVESLTHRLPHERRGRPRKGEPTVEVTEFVVRGEIIAPRAERLEHENQLRGLLVLITNLNDQTAFPARRLLEEYRDQGAVERKFAFLKDPAFVDGLFLHTPRRIEALAYVFVIACLLYSVFERRVRLQLQASQGRILLPGKRWSNNPTGKMLLALVDGLTVARVDAGPWELGSPPHMTARAREVASLAGFDLDAMYAGGPTSPE